MFESKTFRVWFGAILLIAAMSCGRALSAQEKPQRVAPADYRIRVGDVLEVSVYQHPEFSSRVVVMGDGNHALTVSGVKVSDLSAMDGMLHDLKVVDLSALDVGVLLHAKLESVIPEPQVTVMVAPFMQPLPPSTRPSHPTSRYALYPTLTEEALTALLT